jgi:hypothetical protein
MNFRITVCSHHVRDIILSPNIAPQPILDDDKKQLVFVILDTTKHSRRLYFTCIDVDQKDHIIALNDDGCASKWEYSLSCLGKIKVGYLLPLKQHFYTIVTILNTHRLFRTLIKMVETNANSIHLFYHLFYHLLHCYYLHSFQQFLHSFQNILRLDKTQIEAVFGVCEC